jgi:hypothetical protein
MTNPVTARSSPTNAHYDYEAGECRSEPLESPMIPGSEHRPSQSSAPSDPASRAAVDRLVAKQTRGSSVGEGSPDEGKCWRDRVLAAGTCVGAVGMALTATTGVGAILALNAGVACGAKLADVEATCRGK